MMLPDIESLRCFHAAAHHLSFRVAAKTVGLSPAALGDRIKRLEDLLQARLFERTTRRVALTPAGERLWTQARRCLEEAARCVEVARGDAGPSPFSLTVGTRFELGMSWVTPALARLETTHPERRLHLAFGDTPALLHLLQRGEIDCLVTSARVTRGGLRFARLHEERYVFVGQKRLLGARPIAKPEHAVRHTLLELNRELPLFRYFLDARPGDEVWAFDHTQFLGTIGPVRQRALEGAGVAVLPHYFVERDLDRGQLVRILPRVVMPVDWFRLVWHAEHPRQQALHDLAGELSSIPLR
jgi:LysR family transcriptional regulator, glycine cleavage system transcriptional activator